MKQTSYGKVHMGVGVVKEYARGQIVGSCQFTDGRRSRCRAQGAEETILLTADRCPL